MPSNHLILCRPLLLLPSIFPSIRIFSNGSVLHIRWPKYWSFSFSINPSNEYSELISFRMDWLPTIRRIRGDLESAAPGVGADERLRRARIATRVFRPPEIVELPDIGARIHALPADHAPDLDAAVFLVEICGRSFLIGNDTGILPDATWKALAALRGEVRIDVAVLDNTGGFLHDWRSGHMGANAVMETFDRLDGLGLLSAGCVRAVNHFSHTSGGTHAELCAFWEPRGIVVGYDGLVLPADATLGSMSRNESMQF